MKYLCLIYDDEKQWQKFPKEVQDKYMGEYRAFGESVQTSGHDVGANQLQPTHTAESGLELIDKILARGELGDYYPAHAARGELYRRLGQVSDAAAAYRRTLELVSQEPERRFLARRLMELDSRL